uniref:Uncharacterized protein n=1 Tax=Alexandrium monilatum TaxID=311494 RepID=A0A7S4QW33_9DINO
MVFLSQANDCLCGAFAGVRRHSMSAGKPGPAARTPAQLPGSTELPARLAAELQATGCNNNHHCALVGVAGPILAALLGAADGFGFDEGKRARLHIACRRELRQLARVVGPQAASPKAPGWASAGRAARAEPFETALGWCSTPAVPTYGVGVRLALGPLQEGDPARQMATDLAWVFRLLCARARVRDQRQAPMLFAACGALCGSEDVGGRLERAMDLGLRRNRSESLDAVPDEPAGGGLEGSAAGGGFEMMRQASAGF